MQIHIESPHWQLSETQEEMIRQKFDTLAKMFRRIESCDIVVKKEKNDQQKEYFIEGKLQVPRRTLFSSEQAETFEIAIEKLLTDLEHRLRRYKEELEEIR
ncbi:MAG TPA: ribosome-associated translation inhibitor RaiA [Chitinophagaceae bacterium]|nr:ribosome-associated translation inhibitor RaiA [Chitinophagaceae bacterium]